MISDKLPLVVVVGPTSSGKTSLSIKIAELFNGEVICADSRTIYKYMDIGTAKPTEDEMRGIKHWGINLIEPGEYYSASDFKLYANKKIKEIRSRGKLPILVGGSGLYIDSVIFDYQFGAPADSKMRTKLQRLTIDELQDYCVAHKVLMPENNKNKRYLIRAIENANTLKFKNNKLMENTIVVGISTNREALRKRIFDRASNMFNSGVIEETKMLAQKYGWESEAMKSNIYTVIKDYLDGKITKTELVDKSICADWRLAKRQLTWLRRNNFIHWLPLDDAEVYLINTLAKLTKP